MSTPFKMKGWSPFTQKTHSKHHVIPPTEEQRRKSKGTLKNIGPETRNLGMIDRFKRKIKLLTGN